MIYENKTIELPDQFISNNEKEKNNKEYYKKMIKYYDNISSLYPNNYVEKLKLLKARYNKLDSNDYKYILNPLNSDNPDYLKFPAKLRNIPIISPIIDLMISEFMQRPIRGQVLSVGVDVKTEMSEAIEGMLISHYRQIFINELNTKGIDTNQPSKELEDMNKKLEEFKENYVDNISRNGQDRLDYLHYDLDIEEKIRLFVNDFLTFGECCSYKCIRYDDVEYERVSPLDLEYPSGDGLLEDKSWVKRNMYLNKAELVKRFSEVEDFDITKLNNIKYNELDTFRTNQFTNLVGRDGIFRDENIIEERNIGDVDGLYHVRHIVFREFTKVLLVEYVSEITGQIETIKVDESYIEQEGDLSIKTIWDDIIYEGYIIGEDYFFGLKPLTVQRDSINSKSDKKLCYNSILNTNDLNEITSPVKLGLNYQALINILFYKFEKLINKSKDKLMLIPIGILPKKQGWTQEKAMYWADAMGYLFVDESKENAIAAMQQIKSIDLSLGNYIQDMYNIINSIKLEYWDALGMNRQRYGDIKTTDGKANTEQALYRSALITETLYRKIEKFLEKEEEGLIDISVKAWIKGKKAQFRNAEGDILSLNILPLDTRIAEYGAFVKRTPMDKEKLAKMNNFLFAYAQNGGKLGLAFEIDNATSISSMKKIIKKYEKAEQEYNLQIEAEKTKQVEIEANKELELLNNKLEIEKYNTDKEFESDKYDADKKFELGLLQIEADKEISKNQKNIIKK